MSQAGLPSGLFSSMQTSKVADLVEILGSRTMTGRVIKACSLETEFKGWKSREDLVKRVRGTTRIVPPGIKNSAIRIEVKGDRPELVARVANSYVDNLKDALDEMGYNRAARNKTFIERQLERNRAELARAEEALAKYQATNRIASLPETVVASIRSLGDLESQKLGAEIERKRTDELLSAMSTKVQALQLDPNAMVDLQVRKRGLAAQAGALARAQAEFQAKLASLPPKAVALARLQRDVQVANAVYLALTQQLEVAIIGASKESEAFLPLDRADVPVKPVYPKKSIFTLAGLAFGLILGGVLALLQGRRATEILIQ
jgi:tyrosine-protein kinase Etk/Wzc